MFIYNGFDNVQHTGMTKFFEDLYGGETIG